MSVAGFWTNKCVLITGASSGIGQALALDLAKRGARLGLIARREAQLTEVAREVRGGGGVAEFRATDVRQAELLRRAAGELEQALGDCDVAVACAGIYRKTESAALDPVAVEDVLATNVLGVSNLFAAVTPGMVARGRGNLAAVASIAGLIGMPQGGAYSASKAAVIMLLRSLRLDLEKHGIRVTTLCPGVVDTPMITDEERRTVVGIIPVAAAAERIARAIERGQAEVGFPWGQWLEVRLAGLVPWWLYRFMIGGVAPMEEAK
jgi:short-subunit dehydrogenase